MNKAFWVTLVTLIGLALGTGTALAKEHGHDKDKDRDERVEHREHHRDHDRDHHEFRHDDDNHRGWDHGRKTGWHDGDAPPGLAKGHHHHHHETHVAQTASPKPVIRPAAAPVVRPAPRPAPKPVVHRPTDLLKEHAAEQNEKR